MACARAGSETVGVGDKGVTTVEQGRGILSGLMRANTLECCRRNYSTQPWQVFGGESGRRAGTSDAVTTEPRPDGKVWVMAQGRTGSMVGRRLRMDRIEAAPPMTEPHHVAPALDPRRMSNFHATSMSLSWERPRTGCCMRTIDSLKIKQHSLAYWQPSPFLLLL
jgi:hypothetical protein